MTLPPEYIMLVAFACLAIWTGLWVLCTRGWSALMSYVASRQLSARRGLDQREQEKREGSWDW